MSCKNQKKEPQVDLESSGPAVVADTRETSEHKNDTDYTTTTEKVQEPECSCKKMKKPKKKRRAPYGPNRKPNAWMVYLDKWKQEHPEWKKEYKTYKEVLKVAKSSYTPISRGD